MFQRLLPGLSFEPYYACNGHLPNTVHDHEAYLCTGSRHSVYDEAVWIERLSLFVKAIHDQQKKFVGICFGHQMIAHALGGRVEKSAGGWCVGVHRFEAVSHEPWMDPVESGHNLLMLCQDQVMELPENSRVLSTSEHCKTGMFLTGDHMLGIQAHPEFSKEYNQAVFTSRKERIGEKKVDQACESLEIPLHDQVISSWIHNFIQG